MVFHALSWYPYIGLYPYFVYLYLYKKSRGHSLGNKLKRTILVLVEHKCHTSMVRHLLKWFLPWFTFGKQNQELINFFISDVPDTPRNVKVVKETPSSVTLTADPPKNVGGLSISSWMVAYALYGNTTAQSIFFGSGRNSNIQKVLLPSVVCFSIAFNLIIVTLTMLQQLLLVCLA